MFDYVIKKCKQFVNEQNFNIFSSTIILNNFKNFDTKVDNKKKKCC